MNMNWIKWVNDISGHASAQQIARAVGVTPTAVRKWFAGEPSLAGVVGIAIAYHAPIIEGLLAAGIIGDDNLEGLFSLRCIPTDQLVIELRRRASERRTA